MQRFLTLEIRQLDWKARSSCPHKWDGDDPIIAQSHCKCCLWALLKGQYRNNLVDMYILYLFSKLCMGQGPNQHVRFFYVHSHLIIWILPGNSLGMTNSHVWPGEWRGTGELTYYPNINILLLGAPMYQVVNKQRQALYATSALLPGMTTLTQKRYKLLLFQRILR